jgi:hypothetical protein
VSADVVGNAYSLLSRRTADWSLDQPFYVDQEFFDLEMQLFFGRQWLFVALGARFRGSGIGYGWISDASQSSSRAARTARSAHLTTRAGIEDRGSVSRSVVTQPDWYVPIINGPTISTAGWSAPA